MIHLQKKLKMKNSNLNKMKKLRQLKTKEPSDENLKKIKDP